MNFGLEYSDRLLCEPLWAESAGVTVGPGPDPTAPAVAAADVLTLSSESWLALGARGAELYRGQFSLERTVARLRQPGPTPDGPISG